jgi:hypothetical protein
VESDRDSGIDIGFDTDADADPDGCIYMLNTSIHYKENNVKYILAGKAGRQR